MIAHDFSSLVLCEYRAKLRVSYAISKKMLVLSVNSRSHWVLLQSHELALAEENLSS